ncbi:uncharacterized protein LOC128503710 [Spea bombifrons]|uniref:uncharacterized protein LOC128503710 n=1 Tax=Spea bombifrons TaxID=233779 RepID=UPI00234B8C9F|nr:uncharacterized protein LOC128503710 [Spea bombifrons]XP_053329866.1 uncharacterized protein LOC128503710 [Spea bombifrons]XP_053329867.1 uncharacterized protein LOC128503710 [Spea bombifrons]
MKSTPPETGPPKPDTDHPQDGEAETQTKEENRKARGESEKDSGYSDTSSESFSSEETAGTAAASAQGRSQETTQTQAAYKPVYILQNVVLKQPRFLLLQQPLRRHRKRPTSSSYIPILRSYPRIAPRLAPPTPSTARIPTPPKGDDAPPPPHLLDISLRSLALLRRTRETQRSIRELRAHTRLYSRAVQGEEGGWDRLRRAMERSGVYRKVVSSGLEVPLQQEETSMKEDPSPSEKATTPQDENTDLPKTKSSEDVAIKGEGETNSMMQAAS